MIEQQIGIIDNKPYIFCQCETAEEHSKLNLPKNVYSFWKHGDELIFSPGQILGKIQKSIENKTYEPEKLVSKQSVENYYQKLLAYQNQAVIDYAKEQIKIAKNHSNPTIYADYIKQMETLIENHQKRVFDLDMDGVMRPDTNRIKKIIGEENYKEMYPEGSVFLDRQKL